MAGLCISYEGAWDPQVRYKWVPPKRGNTRVWRVASLKEVWEKKKRKMRKLRQKRTQVVAEKELEEVDLGSDSREPRPISISASLTGKEK